jgi:hypothetical protein
VAHGTRHKGEMRATAGPGCAFRQSRP